MQSLTKTEVKQSIIIVKFRKTEDGDYSQVFNDTSKLTDYKLYPIATWWRSVEYIQSCVKDLPDKFGIGRSIPY
jgi:hypothetical protein